MVPGETSARREFLPLYIKCVVRNTSKNSKPSTRMIVDAIQTMAKARVRSGAGGVIPMMLCSQISMPLTRSAGARPAATTTPKAIAIMLKITIQVISFMTVFLQA